MALNKSKPAESLQPAKTEPAAAVELQDHSEADNGTPWNEEAAVAAPVVTPPVTSANKPPATSAGGVMAGLSGDGFDALDGQIGFGSFPIIKLDKDKFDVNGEPLDDFSCVMLQARSKWIHKVGDKDNESIFYSYDGQHDTGGRSVESRYNEWKNEGYNTSGVDVREYMEVMVKMIGTSLDGQLALLSVPPASVKRLGGYRAEVRLSHGLLLNQVITVCKKAPLVKISPKVSFYPWNFSFGGKLPQ